MAMSAFESLIMGIFTDASFVPVLSKEDRTAIMQYYAAKFKQANVPADIDFFASLASSYDMRGHPYSALKAGLIGGAVIKALSGAVDKLQVAKEDLPFLEMLFSIPFFKEKRMDAVRQKIAALKEVKNE